MDVKRAMEIIQAENDPRQADFAEGFLDAIDQLKATGVKEAFKGLMARDGVEQFIAAKAALAKLNALLGEK